MLHASDDSFIVLIDDWTCFKLRTVGPHGRVPARCFTCLIIALTRFFSNAYEFVYYVLPASRNVHSSMQVPTFPSLAFSRWACLHADSQVAPFLMTSTLKTHL